MAKKNRALEYVGVIAVIAIVLALSAAIVFAAIAFGSLLAWPVLSWVMISPALTYAQVLGLGIALTLFLVGRKLVVAPIVYGLKRMGKGLGKLAAA